MIREALKVIYFYIRSKSIINTRYNDDSLHYPIAWRMGLSIDAVQEEKNMLLTRERWPEQKNRSGGFCARKIMSAS